MAPETTNKTIGFGSRQCNFVNKPKNKETYDLRVSLLTLVMNTFWATLNDGFLFKLLNSLIQI